jgi:hypothetical protein
MFAIYIYVLYREGEPEARRQAKSGFAERRDAARFLDAMISRRPTSDAGYDGEQDFWWTRAGDVVTRYTIEPANVAEFDENKG